MSPLVFLWLVLGLVLLVVGAEGLVGGGVRLARRVGISPLVVGLTVVALGTSSPELAVGLGAVYNGSGDVAVGNAIGSNIFNTLCILGIASLIAPLIVQGEVLRRDMPVMLAASFAPVLAGFDGLISRVEGVLLFAGLIGYLVWLIRLARRNPGEVEVDEAAKKPVPPGVKWIVFDVGRVLAGLLLLAIGSDLLVDSASTIARAAGVSELVIGLTIVGAGTGLPELATSLLAAFRGQRDVAVGNVVGSNIFNVLGILGVSAAFAPGGTGLVIPGSVLWGDLPVMILAAVACLPLFFTGGRISRPEGGLLLAAYVLYVVATVLAAKGAGLPDWLENALLWVALPVVALGFTFTTWRETRKRLHA
ncbi:calcium/sodium antiporter [Phycisphaera mikurensis]|uniref:Putative transporter n=1 Tax=Phycisphaera mikurensis (strain NBRC 102666 / KCTC 22515 / FYK2301M01) TaxID=1142394 RepID=I0IH73_PHYMF|nr:calcium/sodium antiporter [Phycisphaera mikurensis]MBB6440862.1 cation:H+ antiporter [Phycisphaera mikurensis]BAM04611.1 putative transporter [Phycisphaera mikurensis NBRC 102666]